jgi:slit protein 2
MDIPGSNDYICKCAPGYSGKRCEYLTSLSFLHNVSYVELEPLNVKPEANVTITFATEQENGVLLYVGDYQHLAVELFRGRIRVSYDIGNNPVSTMFSYEILSDGQYHRVELLSIKKNFTLRVDGGLARSIVNEGDNEFLQVHKSMYLAGVSEQTGEKALKLWHLRNATSFNGCLKEVYINAKLVDFLQAAKSRHKVAPGCNMYQDEQPEPELTNPCSGHKCQEGQCTPADKGKRGYKCVCRTGYEGRFCENKRQRKRGRSQRQQQASKKCRKEKYRDYYIEPDGCRSVKPYKMSNCVGGGRNADSCAAIKTKPRAVRFVCGDGRKFKKNVVAVRKCGRKKKVWG